MLRFLTDRINLCKFLFTLIVVLSLLLNFYQFDSNPPGLYIDEVSIGVNAYSILKTGKDEYGEMYPVYFKSLNDYKLPVYIYLASISMYFFGKNDFAVRFPSAFFGTLAVILIYCLINELLIKNKFNFSRDNKKYPLLTSFLLAVSPWFLQFVGPAFEVTVAFSLLIISVYLILISQRKSNISVFVMGLFLLVVTAYTYHSYKIFIPTILIYLLIKLIKQHKVSKQNTVRIILTVLFFIPVIYSYLIPTANIRFFQTSAFSSLSVNDAIIFIKNYISYFSTDFLFSFGDGINRHQFLNFGPLARWMLPFMLIGLFTLFRTHKSYLRSTILAVLLIAPIPASLALPSPHTLRSLTIVLAYVSAIAYGILIGLHKFKNKNKLYTTIISFLFIYEFSIYLHYGFFHYPKVSLMDWGGNYKEVVEKASLLSRQYKYIVIDMKSPFVLEYFRFYNEDLKPLVIKPGWKKDNNDQNDRILVITDDKTGQTPASEKFIGNVYLTNINRDIFAQFWEL